LNHWYLDKVALRMSRAIFGGKAACEGDGCSKEARAAGLGLMERYFKSAQVA
jgi:hypothetical protein